MHWLAWEINPEDRRVVEGERVPRERCNDFREVSYRGPCPPHGHGSHRYRFHLYALAIEPAIPAGASRTDVEHVIEGNVLAVAELVGTYER
jgi:Raf kinase inhibitor-like YbhB/YbcL family protein